MENVGETTFKHEGDYTFVLDEQGEQVGEMTTSPGQMEQRSARMAFGDVYRDEPVRRTNGIYLDDAYQGAGLGQKLYLAHMSRFPGVWFYNSQSWPDATNTLKTLSGKGLIELHWRVEPNFSEEGGTHMSRLTNRGIQLAKGLEVPNSPKKPSMAPKPPELPSPSADPI